MEIEDLRSVVRPVVTLMFAMVFCGLAISGQITSGIFTTVAGMIFAYWFKSRDEVKK